MNVLLTFLQVSLSPERGTGGGAAAGRRGGDRVAPGDRGKWARKTAGNRAVDRNRGNEPLPETNKRTVRYDRTACIFTRRKVEPTQRELPPDLVTSNH